MDQGLIKDEHDQNAQLIQAVTNRLVRVHGRFKHNGTFVIQLIESSPPPPKPHRSVGLSGRSPF
jgi:hypothetical protein